MTHHVVQTFFQQFLNRDAGVMARVDRIKEDLFVDEGTGVLVFSLSSLYECLCDQLDMSFIEFKLDLYKGEFNQSLIECGGQVSIYQSNGKIDANLYQLKSLTNKSS